MTGLHIVALISVGWLVLIGLAVFVLKAIGRHNHRRYGPKPRPPHDPPQDWPSNGHQ